VFLLVSGYKGFLKSCRDMWSLDGRETQDYDPQQHLQFRDMYKCHLVVSSVQEKVRKRNEELQESATKRRKLEEKRYVLVIQRFINLKQNRPTTNSKGVNS